MVVVRVMMVVVMRMVICNDEDEEDEEDERSRYLITGGHHLSSSSYLDDMIRSFSYTGSSFIKVPMLYVNGKIAQDILQYEAYSQNKEKVSGVFSKYGVIVAFEAT